jgi:hypothetical protein
LSPSQPECCILRTDERQIAFAGPIQRCSLHGLKSGEFPGHIILSLRRSCLEVIERCIGYTHYEIIDETIYCCSLWNLLIWYFYIQWRLSHSLKHEWPHSSNSIKQTTIGLIRAEMWLSGQVIIYLELMMTYLGGTFFLCGVYIASSLKA